MIIHTLVYRFADSVDESQRREFFTDLEKIARGSGLVTHFGHGPHHRLPVDDHAAGTTANAVAQFACRDLDDLRAFSELPHVHEHIAGWRSRIEYDAAYANHDDLLHVIAPALTKESPMHHTEHTVTVNAPAAIVWDVLVDVEGYARIFPPTEDVKMLEESPEHQIARLTVDVNGEVQSWISRRDIDAGRRVIAYRQLENAPMMGYMGGEWRALPIDEHTTQLVLTHDFKPREPEDGLIAGKFTYEQADEMIKAAVERNSVADLGAVKDEAEKLAVEGAAE
ncbi:Ribosome association toxin PasT (RatA) of the RatAB toxin-antitoxin module [Streptomyces sp. 1222.5]|uniref:aromatase/cyclase n=1 Tax=unclassified Streptomyces TaxID=2593676 RepID=UPI0008987DBB|nr:MULTISPECIES: aromatase/cyclase [unclassified Streptomyces]PKW12089.1 ribosome-associated toxin RatA of RatAB toxin-antitoxin module [Streptomyces sp. 5112.2]SEB62937.1 Ribosome association toxin PasT (RatA) of the RatAB toxin-antitoxin module [Streptomyces sp. 1222.5]